MTRKIGEQEPACEEGGEKRECVVLQSNSSCTKGKRGRSKKTKEKKRYKA